jgi:hypothetical protein
LRQLLLQGNVTAELDRYCWKELLGRCCCFELLLLEEILQLPRVCMFAAAALLLSRTEKAAATVYAFFSR